MVVRLDYVLQGVGAATLAYLGTQYLMGSRPAHFHGGEEEIGSMLPSPMRDGENQLVPVYREIALRDMPSRAPVSPLILCIGVAVAVCVLCFVFEMLDEQQRSQ